MRTYAWPDPRLRCDRCETHVPEDPHSRSSVPGCPGPEGDSFDGRCAAEGSVIGHGDASTERVPAAEAARAPEGRGPGGALPLGAAFAFGWTPCAGPVLASILATAAGSATIARGALLLLAYSLGLGLPFLLVARGIVRGRGRSQWLRRNSRRIEIIGGVLLIGMGLAMMTGGWTVLKRRMLAGYARLGWPPI